MIINIMRDMLKNLGISLPGGWRCIVGGSGSVGREYGWVPLEARNCFETFQNKRTNLTSTGNRASLIFCRAAESVSGVDRFGRRQPGRTWRRDFGASPPLRRSIASSVCGFRRG